MTTFQPIFKKDDIKTLVAYQSYFRKNNYSKIGKQEDNGIVHINDEFFDAVDAIFVATTLQIQQLTTQEVLKENVKDYDTRLEAFLAFMQGNFEANLVSVAKSQDHNLHHSLLQNVLSKHTRYSGGVIAHPDKKHFDTEYRYEQRRNQQEHDEAKAIIENMTFVSQIDSQLNSLIARKNALQILQQYRTVDTNFTKFMHNKEQYEQYVGRMIDSHNWNQCYTVKTGDHILTTYYEVNGTDAKDKRIGLNITHQDLINLFENTNISLDHEKLLMNGRKTIIQAVEEVPQEEIEAAAKKMKFNGNLSNVRCYKITEGFKVKNSRIFNDYWLMRRCDTDTIEGNLESLVGKFIIVSENDTSKFQAITTSIGRSLSSVNRKVTTGVIDALALSF